MHVAEYHSQRIERQFLILYRILARVDRLIYYDKKTRLFESIRPNAGTGLLAQSINRKNIWYESYQANITGLISI